MALPQDYRVQIENQTSETISSVDVYVTRWKVDSDNALSYESTAMTSITTTTSVTDGNYLDGDTEDNGSNKYLGLKGFWEFTTAGTGTPDGPVTIRLQFSRTDGASANWPTNGQGIVLDTIYATGTSATFRGVFEYR